MKKLFYFLPTLLGLALSVLIAGCGAPAAETPQKAAYLTVTDAADRKVVLTERPQRIVSLSPSYLGMIEAVGGSLIGRASSKVGTVPAVFADVPEVGLVYNINMEALVALKPDLVLAGRNQHDKFVPLMESNGIKVIELDAKTYEEVRQTVALLGRIYGKEEAAAAENALLDKEIAAVKAKLPKDKKTRIVIMHATASAVTVEGSRSVAGCAAALLGLQNVAAQALGGRADKTPYSMESLVAQDPDLIFITSMGKPAEIQNRLRMDFRENPAWNSLRAVQAGRVYVLPEELFLLNPGLRYPEAVEYMAKIVYPEAF